MDEILARLRAASTVLVPLHRNPDGDSVGSALAASLLLRRWGITHTCLSADPVPSALRFLPGVETIRREDPATLVREESLLLCLDSPALHRFTRRDPVALQRALILNIDHHLANEQFGIVNLVAPRSSTAELMLELAGHAGESLDRDLATCLLTGLLTDTASFWHVAIPEALETAARLQRAGADYDAIVRATLKNLPLSVLRLWAEALRELHVEEGGQVVWAILPHAVLAAARLPSEDLHGAVVSVIDRLLRNIQGAEVAFLCAEEAPGLVQVELRAAAPGADVWSIARVLGGGGHRAAAGAVLPGDVEQAARQVLDVLRERR